jgi:hypothetical protein
MISDKSSSLNGRTNNNDTNQTSLEERQLSDARLELQFKLVFWQQHDLTSEQRRSVFRACGSLLSNSNYAAIVEERVVSGRCGYPLCMRQVKAAPNTGVLGPLFFFFFLPLYRC